MEDYWKQGEGGGLLETRGRKHLIAQGKCWECSVSLNGHCSQKLSLVMHKGGGAEAVNVHHTLLYLVTRASAKNWKEV